MGDILWKWLLYYENFIYNLSVQNHINEERYLNYVLFCDEIINSLFVSCRIVYVTGDWFVTFFRYNIKCRFTDIIKFNKFYLNMLWRETETILDIKIFLQSLKVYFILFVITCIANRMYGLQNSWLHLIIF